LRQRSLDDWGIVIDRIAASSFCRGKGNRGWVADFDWLLDSETAVRVLEGRYDDETVRQAEHDRPELLEELYDKASIANVNRLTWFVGVTFEVNTLDHSLVLMFPPKTDDERRWVERHYHTSLLAAAKRMGYSAITYKETH
jgi:hypothetical protein